MSTEITATAADYISRFRAAFIGGIENIVNAAEIYVAAIDENPKDADAFQAAFEDCIPASSWACFEAVGRRWMHPKLLLGGGKNGAKIKRLPYSVQERIFSGEKFDLLLPGGDVLRVDVREVDRAQADQLLDGDHVRTKSQQKAYLAAAAPASTDTEVMPYTIHGGKVHFRRNVALDKAELRRILTEI